MSFQVLARKWRPRKFSEVVGQEHVVQSLTNALQHDRLHHAYLFTGTRGVGKTTLARILAKALNCEDFQGTDPCGQCPVCQDIDAGHFIDLIEVDAASRTKVEDTRDLLDNVQYAPGRGRYKIYLIDEVHMLSGHSFNALLKTLEEPPPHVKFLLATTDPQKIPVTILSRCLQFNLKHLYPDQIQPQLQFILEQEQIEFDVSALALLARAADGSMRDALSLLDQAIVHGNGVVNIEPVRVMLGTVNNQPVAALLKVVADHDAQAVLDQIGALAELATDFIDVTDQLLQMLHRVAIAQVLPAAVQHEDNGEIITELAQTIEPEDVQLYYQIALIGRRDLRLAPALREGFEMMMLRMLAFKPISDEATTVSAPKQSQVVAAKPVASSAAKPLQNTVETSTEAPVTVSETEPQPRPAISGEHDWPVMIQAMKIGGMTRELANNCVIESIDEQVCTLNLDPGHKHLRSEMTEQNLLKAVQRYFGKTIKLVIAVKDVAQDTPAVQINRDREQRQQEAEQMLNDDENVRALKEKFDARVIPGSIEPL